MFIYETNSIINYNGKPFKVNIKITQEPSINEGFKTLDDATIRKKEKELNGVLNITKKDMKELCKTPYGKAILARDLFMQMLSLFNPPFLDTMTISCKGFTDKSLDYYNCGMVEIEGFYDKNNPKMSSDLTEKIMHIAVSGTINYLADNKCITDYNVFSSTDHSTYFIIVK